MICLFVCLFRVFVQGCVPSRCLFSCLPANAESGVACHLLHNQPPQEVVQKESEMRFNSNEFAAQDLTDADRAFKQKDSEAHAKAQDNAQKVTNSREATEVRSLCVGRCYFCVGALQCCLVCLLLLWHGSSIHVLCANNMRSPVQSYDMRMLPCLPYANSGCLQSNKQTNIHT